MWDQYYCFLRCDKSNVNTIELYGGNTLVGELVLCFEFSELGHSNYLITMIPSSGIVEEWYNRRNVFFKKLSITRSFTGEKFRLFRDLVYLTFGRICTIYCI